MNTHKLGTRAAAIYCARRATGLRCLAQGHPQPTARLGNYKALVAKPNLLLSVELHCSFEDNLTELIITVVKLFSNCLRNLQCPFKTIDVFAFPHWLGISHGPFPSPTGDCNIMPHRCVLCHYNKPLMNALFAQLALYKSHPEQEVLWPLCSSRDNLFFNLCSSQPVSFIITQNICSLFCIK